MKKFSDPALANRFDTINFPNPKLSVLLDHALNIISNSVVITTKRAPFREEIAGWIRDNQIQNFRIIESKIEQYVLTKNPER